MKLEILHVPDCPSVVVLEQRLGEVFGSDLPLEVTYRIVADLETALAVGMTGSPTLLVDGVDPFARPGLTPSVACRLYPDENGVPTGAPSVDVLRRVLGGGSPATSSGISECAEPDCP